MDHASGQSIPTPNTRQVSSQLGRVAGKDAGLKAYTVRRRPRTPRAARLDVFGDFAGFEAAGADVFAAGCATHVDANLLEVCIEAALRGDHRVGAAVPE